MTHHFDVEQEVGKFSFPIYFSIVTQEVKILRDKAQNVTSAILLRAMWGGNLLGRKGTAFLERTPCVLAWL